MNYGVLLQQNIHCHNAPIPYSWVLASGILLLSVCRPSNGCLVSFYLEYFWGFPPPPLWKDHLIKNLDYQTMDSIVLNVLQDTIISQT